MMFLSRSRADHAPQPILTTFTHSDLKYRLVGAELCYICDVCRYFVFRQKVAEVQFLLNFA